MENPKFDRQLIVPGLGVVILLSSFLLGVPLIYQLLLALLGAAAVGTYFAPSAVQVETRIGIAALGLVILLIVSSTAFWLALLSFGAIAALQLEHRHTLQRRLATLDWLNAALKGAQARRSGRTGSADGNTAGEAADNAAGEADGEAAAVHVGDDSESKPKAPLALDALPAFVRLNVAGIGSSLLGALLLVSALQGTWVGFLARGYGEVDVLDLSLTLSEAAEQLGEDLPFLGALAIAMLALAAGSILSVVLPRIVAGLVAAAGLAVNLAIYLYVFQEVEGADLGSIGIDLLAIPSGGAIIAAICSILIIVFQLIPRFNRSRG